MKKKNQISSSFSSYEEKELLIWSNCGEREEIDWNMLFDTDKKYYVGMVKFQ